MAFLKAENISISFGGLKALNRVCFDVNKREIFSIIGPNGAGKTTIFNCINRFYDLDEGSFYLEDRDISRIKPHTIADMGIARTFQNIELFKNMTVLDNLILGQHRRRRLQVPHLTHQNHVGVLPQDMLQRLGKGAGIAAQLPLGYGTLNRRVNVLNGVFNGDYVAAFIMVQMVNHGRLRGALAAAGRPGDYYQSPWLHGKLFIHRW